MMIPFAGVKPSLSILSGVGGSLGEIMENAMQLTIGKQQTMSTREIAQLIEKLHSNIKISAERLAERGVIALQETPYIDPQNRQTYTEYLLTKRDSLILVAQNCPEFTARIVDRWQELEAQQAFVLPKTLPEALRLAADLAEKNELQALRLEQQRPAVEFVERYVEARSSKAISDVAKIIGAKPKAFFEWLHAEGVIFKRGGSWLPYSTYEHHFEVKTGEASGHAFTQSRFTPRGIEWVAGRWNAAAEK